MNYFIFYFSENLTREKIIIPVWPAPSVSGSGGQMEAATLDLALNSLPRRRRETSKNTQNTRQQGEVSCRHVGRSLHLTPLCLMIMLCYEEKETLLYQQRWLENGDPFVRYIEIFKVPQCSYFLSNCSLFCTSYQFSEALLL